MIVSQIKNANFLYFSLHAEEVFTSNYIKDNNDGIFVRSLQYETVCRLFAHLQDDPPTGIKYLILDFRYIEHLQNNILDKIIEIRNLGYKLIFKNVTEVLIKPLSLENIENVKNIANESGRYDLFYFFASETEEIYSNELRATVLFSNYFKELIKEKYISPYNQKHASSFVYLHSFIDLKKLISLERPFIYFALYKLAVKIYSKWKSEIDNGPILVGQSLTSTFIVSILSKMLKLDILIFDKIGPINKLYNKLEKHSFENTKYIIVSDLVCLGTEVKITKNLIEFSGGKYLGNVSLVKIETLTREDLQLDNVDRTIAIFSVSEHNNEELGYYIYTNLKPLNE
ncbi:Uncharacterised protein [Chryseobacterium nakagawai]|uniref:hypothetical protein n=1 Tax=Chryseobacterium nakagawai TaxID=1241982 RepID=UPI000F516D02|nr:hypothetical protein [Chryseobacterium nakagawai]VEH21458.1 Uncharacterised protein [Chryseobacterium nakagawai]